MAVPVPSDLEPGAMIEPTTSDIARNWDAIVIGAGPAGSIAAREIARRGLEVLLVDKSAFPRFKVCGCCLNRDALGTLDRVGLGHVPASLGATTLDSVTVVSHRGRRATLPLSGGCAVSRERLDDVLVHRAIESGVEFLPVCVATVGGLAGESRIVQLGGTSAHARIVIAADGLAGTSLAKLDEFEPRITARSRIGIGAVLEHPPAAFARGAVTMICGRYGYMGVVWVEDNRLDIAAAVDSVWLKTIGGPQAAVASMLAHAGIDADLSCAWRGTPALTRRRRVEAERLMVIGDAAGYVEPFTGEGMAWAMAGAKAAAEVASATIHGATTKTWTDLHRTLIGRGQRECRSIAAVLRHPCITDATIRALAAMPSLAAPIVRRINHGRGRGAEAIA
jgi:menaquinone-9 beta-reductase